MPDRRFCCTSSASDAPQQPPAHGPAAATGEEEGVPPEDATLRGKLAALKPSTLTRRAASDGIDAEKIKAAKDSTDPKQALIELIIVAAARSPTPAVAARLQALRDELSALKPSELEERALAAGIDAEKVDEAVDGDAPIQTLTELILALATTTQDAQNSIVGTTIASANDTLSNELARQKPSTRRGRAVAAGASMQEIEDAEDLDDPVGALAVLIARLEKQAQEPASLAEELVGLKPSALRIRAQAVGATEEEIEEASDAADVATALAGLILAREGQQSDPQAKLRIELLAMKPSALRKRAQAAGATEEEIEEAGDAADAVAALADLILRREKLADQRAEVPHFGTTFGKKQVAQAGAVKQTLPTQPKKSAKHAMLSCKSMIFLFCLASDHHPTLPTLTRSLADDRSMGSSS